MPIYNGLNIFLGIIKMIKVSRMADYAILLVCKMSSAENKVYSAHELSTITALKITTISKTNIIELYIFKYCEEKTAGTIIKITNGLVIPPVKKSKILNCIISKLKYIVEVTLFS